MIYLDNNATSYLDSVIAARMHELAQEKLANPASQHSAGRRARMIVESARDRILAGVNARTQGMGADQLLFTSGGTEANNLALFGLSEQKPGRILISAIEHPSVLGAAERLRQMGEPRRPFRCCQTASSIWTHCALFCNASPILRFRSFPLWRPITKRASFSRSKQSLPFVNNTMHFFIAMPCRCWVRLQSVFGIGVSMH